MEFRILGPLEVSAAGEPLPLGGPTQRALLAILLLHANEAVHRERLVDEIWGEQPPRTAEVSLNGYVSKLRKLLTNGSGAALETRGGGYALLMEPERLDVNEFQRLAAEGREARAEGRPREAEKRLAAALALWRGRPLADLEYAPFAQPEIGRLQELRLGAVEDSLETQLDLGRHASVVGELEKLAAENPLRERPVGLLMLALYRSRRQAEALQAYDAMRRRLAEELGLEPSPWLQDLQRQVLQHDPAVAAPVAERSLASPSPSWISRKRTAVLVAAVCAVAVAVALAVALPRSAGGTAVAADSLAVLDPARDAFVGDVPLGKSPTLGAYAFGAVWALNERGHVVSRVAPHPLRVADNISVPAGVDRLAAGRRWLWLVASGSGRLFRIDPRYDELDNRSVRACSGCGAALAGGAGSVWMTDGFTGLVRVDPASLRTTQSPTELDGGAHGVAVGLGAVWVAGDGVTRVDPATLLPAGVPIPVGNVDAIAVGAGAVWAAVGQKVVKIDPSDDSVQASVPVGSNPSSIAVGGRAVWVANSSSGTITKIDPSRAAVVDTIRVGRSPVGLVFGGGRLWVTVQ